MLTSQPFHTSLTPSLSFHSCSAPYPTLKMQYSHFTRTPSQYFLKVHSRHQAQSKNFAKKINRTEKKTFSSNSLPLCSLQVLDKCVNECVSGVYTHILSPSACLAASVLLCSSHTTSKLDGITLPQILIHTNTHSSTDRPFVPATARLVRTHPTPR